ncbi:RidA family protein [Streptomyces sp. NPDC004609]|uniref:RidA family protein n=1 Tax=Streptomyces sp. NPDC004609 TaxID=3364704 RepID=UPI00369D9154
MSSNRRDFIRKAPAVAAVATVPLVAGAGSAAADSGRGRPHRPRKEVHYPDGSQPPENPLFSPIVTYGDMVYISGIGAHFAGDIRQHTDHVLNEIERYLESVGSSMEKVLKVNVYLNTLDDYDGMNEVFRGRWGRKPGVRTTIAAAAGIPGDSLVEIDCIAVR